MTRILNAATLTSHGNIAGREALLQILEAGLQAADPYNNTLKAIRVEGDRLIVGHRDFEPAGDPQAGDEVIDLAKVHRIYVFGAGKGIQRVAKAIEDALGNRLTGGHVIDKKGADLILERIEVTLGAHPVPDEDCVRGCQRILEMAKDLREDDLVFTVACNGVSALLTLPVPGVSLEGVRRTTCLMQIEQGAPTQDLNPVRNHLDVMKGGRISAHLQPARAIHLIAVAPSTYEQLMYHNLWLHNLPDCTTFADAVRMLKKWNVWEAVPASVHEHLSRADSLGIPLYQHIGGVNACILPVPGVITVVGSTRYGGGARSGGKPSYSMMCYGFTTFAEAAYAGWDISNVFARLLSEKLGVDGRFGYGHVPAGVVKHDRELWDIMVEAIAKAGYEGRIGLQVDVAAGTYYDKAKDRFVGLFSAEDKTRDDLTKLYKNMVAHYPFVIIEDPLDEDDHEGHAIVTRELDIEVVGDDLFTTNPQRVQQGIDAGACNTVLLKVNQIGTISEAFDMVRLAYRHGYGVMPCNSRGEGVAIADYCVGLHTGHLREGATGPVGNRFLEIEAELGSRAQFLGCNGLKHRRHT